MALTGQKRKGRPPKSELGPATISLAMRIRPELYEEIRLDAEKNGRSISAQAERRLLYREPTSGEVGRLIQLVVDAVEQRARKSLSEDERVKKQCRAAVDFTLNVLLGSPVAEQALRSAIDFQMFRLERQVAGQRGLLDDALPPPSLESARQMLRELQDLSDARRTADEILGHAFVAGESDAEAFSSVMRDKP